MARHRVEICGVNTANIKVLSNEEMTNLFISYQNGCDISKQELINGNLKLVLSILKKYNNRTDNMDDLFQVGCIGLIKAIDNFDLSQGVRFSTYAVPMILGEVKRYLRDNSSLRVARSVKDIAYKALKVKERLTNELNMEPSNKMIAKELGLEEIEVNNALDAMREAISMSEPIYNDGGDTIYLQETLADKSDKIGIDMSLMMREAIDKLKPKERYIILQRFFEGKTQVELSEEIGISQAQISRIEKNGLDTMKKVMK